ncbi:PAS domain-containing protein, partial [Bradyrhizobium sp.]|uniref:PAS domain-containing protein n=1 Tax=Bradyrhizobium sp. TaxID=376 RepID=UPI003C506972
VWNRGAERLFGFTAPEAVGQPLDIIIPAGLRDRHWHGFQETMRTGKTRYADGQILAVPASRKDGTRLSVEFTIVPFAGDDGHITGIAAIMRDATARFQELQSLRKQLAAHGEHGDRVIPVRMSDDSCLFPNRLALDSVPSDNGTGTITWANRSRSRARSIRRRSFALSRRRPRTGRWCGVSWRLP